MFFPAIRVSRRSAGTKRSIDRRLIWGYYLALSCALKISIPAALAAAAFPPEDPAASCAPGILYVLFVEKPVVVAGDVDEGGVGEGIRPGCG